MFAIEESVEKVNRIARQHYREGELYPAMQDLVEASATTVTLMGDLNKSLQCQHLYRLVILTDSVAGIFMNVKQTIKCNVFFMGIWNQLSNQPSKPQNI